LKKVFITTIVLVFCIILIGCIKPESPATQTTSTEPESVITLETEILAEGLVFPECPRWHNGKLWFSDMHAHQVMTVDLDGNIEIIVEVPGQPGGLGWLPDGRLLVVSQTDKRLLRLDPNGLTEVADLSKIASGVLNDMVVDSQGRAYIGNFGVELGPSSYAPAEIIMVTPEGDVRVVVDNLKFPNGAVITPDGCTLIVAESFGFCLTAFDIESDDSLTEERVWAYVKGRVPQFPDGICLDAEGAVWVSSALANQVIRVQEGGKVTHRVSISPNQAFACALGGPDMRTLFILTAEKSDPDEARAKVSGRVDTVEVEVPGADLP